MTSSDDDAADWTKEEEGTQDKGEDQQLQQQLNSDKLDPKPSCIHRFFLFIKYLTIAAAANMFLGQIIGLAYEVVGGIQIVLRIYVVMLCLLVILNELAWTKYTRDSTLLHLWITRGLVYSFVGVLGLEENSVSPYRESTIAATPALLYLKGVAWMMVACGCTYIALGALCLQIVDDRMKKDLAQRKERAKEAALVADDNWSSDKDALVTGATPA